MTTGICAVVLTYNRRELLDECLDAILAQTVQCDRIIVIDNASTDGTFEMLAVKWSHRADVYSLPQNAGAAGGFNMGMRMAYRIGAEFIWVMDDDVIADPDALERLMAADSLLKRKDIHAPFVISTARTPRGHVTNVPEVDRGRNSLSYHKWPELLEYRMVPVRRATFVSILLPRSTLERYGLPIADMFIWGEDTEYTLRITRQTPGYIVGDSRAVHVRQVDGNPDIRTETNPVRIGYHYHYIRNSVYTIRKYGHRRTLMRHLLKKARFCIALCKERQFDKAGIVLRGLADGLHFTPKVERADAEIDESGIRTMLWTDVAHAQAARQAAQATERL